MGTISIIYRDPEQAALRVEFHGVEFFHNVPTPIPDDDEHRELIAICEAHPHFTVARKTVKETAGSLAALLEDDDDEAETKSSHVKRQEKARRSGAAAYHAGHAREPPAIRFKEAWLEGFDAAAARLSEADDGQSRHPVS